MRQFERKCTVLDADITAQVTMLDEGIHVLLTGGESAHVGAVALAQKGELLACPSFSGHKEQVVCEHWAEKLSRETNGCVTVCCGIHYDHAKPKQIQEILLSCEELLQEIQSYGTLCAGRGNGTDCAAKQGKEISNVNASI